MSDAEDALLKHFARGAFVFDRPKKVGVAVSGGSDSMATLHLLASVADEKGWVLSAVTVDHGLRAESATEAEFVAAACAKIGVSHETLKWNRSQSTGNLQDQARRGRYGLITRWAQGRRITHIVLGHTADDQAETFLMNLARGSGIDGLAGMRHRWSDDGITWTRPFLLQDRADLRAWLSRRGIAWVDDPSNEDTTYQRVKARKALAALGPLGIDAQVLSGVTVNLASVRQALAHQTHEIAQRIARVDMGDVVIDRCGLQTAPSEVQRRLLIAALRWVSGAVYPPRETALIAADIAITRGKNHTLAGCRILTDKEDLRITREARAVRDACAKPGEVWDDRWIVTGPLKRVTVKQLGADGLRQCPDWRETGRPRASLLASVAVWRGETLLAAPLAGLENGWKAALQPGRADFFATLLSH